MKKLILSVLLVCSACSKPPPYESVTINLSGGISCTERLLLDNRDSSSVRFDSRTDSTVTSLDLDLGGFAGALQISKARIRKASKSDQKTGSQRQA